jgi:hypothetical protein
VSADPLSTASRRLREDPSRIRDIFPVIGRQVGRSPVRPDEDPQGFVYGTRDERARASLVVTLAELITGELLAAELAALYHRGAGAERAGVLRGLSQLTTGAPGLVAGSVAAVGVRLHEDALRANDLRLVAAAVGAFAARHLDRHLWRHAVLKCLFTGIPLAAVAQLDRCADAELARMVRDFVAERRAAGRPEPIDAHRVLILPV